MFEVMFSVAVNEISLSCVSSSSLGVMYVCSLPLNTGKMVG